MLYISARIVGEDGGFIPAIKIVDSNTPKNGKQFIPSSSNIPPLVSLSVRSLLFISLYNNCFLTAKSILFMFYFNFLHSNVNTLSCNFYPHHIKSVYSFPDNFSACLAVAVYSLLQVCEMGDGGFTPVIKIVDSGTSKTG